MTQIFEAPDRDAAARSRADRGPAILSRGFRPFFLAAGVWALVGMAILPPFFAGEVAVPTAFSPIDWHAHEMIFGYGGAVVAGFLLTAIPNWAGRLPVAGVAAREVVAGGNWRNLKVTVVVLALALVNVAFHIEDARSGVAYYSTRAALGLVVVLILLIGGRVTPS